MVGINKLKIRILALIWAVLGSLSTLIFVFYINSINNKKEKPKEKKVVEIKTVEKKKPPKKKQKKVVKKTTPKKNISKALPPPTLSEGISGIEVSLPELSMDTNIVSANTKDIIGNVNKNVVMTLDAVDQPPTPIERVAPAYPEIARAKGITGYVVLSVLIDENGNVVKAKILESNPEGIFDNPALTAIKQWKFEPGKYKGKPVKVWIKQKINFKLQ